MQDMNENATCNKYAWITTKLPFDKGSVFKVLRTGLLLAKFIYRVPRFALEDEGSCGGASSSGASNGGATFFCQPRLGFEFDFGLTGSSLLACSSPLFSVSHSIINSRSWRHLVCIIIVGLELPLVEIRESTPPHFTRSVFYS